MNLPLSQVSNTTHPEEQMFGRSNQGCGITCTWEPPVPPECPAVAAVAACVPRRLPPLQLDPSQSTSTPPPPPPPHIPFPTPTLTRIQANCPVVKHRCCDQTSLATTVSGLLVECPFSVLPGSAHFQCVCLLCRRCRFGLYWYSVRCAPLLFDLTSIRNTVKCVALENLE